MFRSAALPPPVSFGPKHSCSSFPLCSHLQQQTRTGNTRFRVPAVPVPLLSLCALWKTVPVKWLPVVAVMRPPFASSIMRIRLLQLSALGHFVPTPRLAVDICHRRLAVANVSLANKDAFRVFTLSLAGLLMSGVRPIRTFLVGVRVRLGVTANVPSTFPALPNVSHLFVANVAYPLLRMLVLTVLSEGFLAPPIVSAVSSVLLLLFLDSACSAFPHLTWFPPP